ncbi:MAG: hypothetical protein AAB065_00130, partial [Deltaproteobacteria bacterium]
MPHGALDRSKIIRSASEIGLSSLAQFAQKRPGPNNRAVPFSPSAEAVSSSAFFATACPPPPPPPPVGAVTCNGDVCTVAGALDEDV